MSIWTDLLVMQGYVATPLARALLPAEHRAPDGAAAVPRAAAGAPTTRLQREVLARPSRWQVSIRLR